MPRGIYKYPEERKLKISNTLKGVKKSRDTVEKIRLAKTIYKTDDEKEIHKEIKRKKARDKYYKNHKESLVKAKIKHYLRRNRTVGSFTYHEWELLKKQYGYICPCCGSEETKVKKLTVDHVIPISKGGSNYIENIQPLCLMCNLKKRTKVEKYEPVVPTT